MHHGNIMTFLATTIKRTYHFSDSTLFKYLKNWKSYRTKRSSEIVVEIICINPNVDFKIINTFIKTLNFSDISAYDPYMSALNSLKILLLNISSNLQKSEIIFPLY